MRFEPYAGARRRSRKLRHASRPNELEGSSAWRTVIGTSLTSNAMLPCTTLLGKRALRHHVHLSRRGQGRSCRFFELSSYLVTPATSRIPWGVILAIT